MVIKKKQEAGEGGEGEGEKEKEEEDGKEELEEREEGETCDFVHMVQKLQCGERASHRTEEACSLDFPT